MVLDADFFYSIDAVLMFMSKGGITLDRLNRMGIRTKYRYLEQLETIFKKFYGGDQKKEANVAYQEDGVLPPGL